jgi:hypothetical protein
MARDQLSFLQARAKIVQVQIQVVYPYYLQ